MDAPEQTFFPERGSILLQSNTRNCSDASFFNRDAEEIAKHLCGSYIWLPRRNITVRILETKAYSKREPHLYNKVFASVPPTQLATRSPGHLLALETVASSEAGSDAYFYVSAGAGDIVFIKALEPLEGLDEIRRRRGGVQATLKMFGPMIVADVFKPDLPEGSVVPLYNKGLVQLFTRPASIEAHVGKRVSNKLMFTRDGNTEGRDTLYRFVAKYLSNSNEVLKAAGKKYPNSEVLKRSTEDI